MAQRSLPRQLVAEGFPNQETSVKARQKFSISRRSTGRIVLH
jgi:hypothetical protein